MKYLTLIMMSMTVLLFAACSSGSEEPTATPEVEETKPALATAVPTDSPESNDEGYPAARPLPEPDNAYPGGEMPTVEPYDPYPDQDAETRCHQLGSGGPFRTRGPTDQRADQPAHHRGVRLRSNT